MLQKRKSYIPQNDFENTVCMVTDILVPWQMNKYVF